MADQAVLTGFEQLFAEYRGRPVSEVIFAIGGTAPLTDHRDLAGGLEMEEEVELVIKARVSGHHYKAKGAHLHGIVTLDVSDVRFADGTAILSRRASKEAVAAKEAEGLDNAYEGNEESAEGLAEEVAKKRRRRKEPAGDILEQAEAIASGAEGVDD